MIDNILELLGFDFFQNAIIASLLTGVICGIIGTYIVARRIVFLSGGITHASFGGLGIAYFAGLSPLLGAALFSLASALGIQYISEKKKTREDSLIGMFWAAGMAIGILFIFMTPGYAPNLMSYLFGSVLTVSFTQIMLMLGLCLVTIVVFYLFFRPIFYIAFDTDYAKTHRIQVNLFNRLLMSLLALTIVLSINVVGIILVIAYLTIPQSIAAIFYKDFKSMLIASAIICPLGSLIGLFASALLNIPSGATIIVGFIILYLLALLLNKIFRIK